MGIQQVLLSWPHVIMKSQGEVMQSTDPENPLEHDYTRVRVCMYIGSFIYRHLK